MGRGRGCLCCQHEMAPARRRNGKFGWCDLDALDVLTPKRLSLLYYKNRVRLDPEPRALNIR